MLRVQNITSETHQIHTIILADFELRLVLRFLPRAQIWIFDAEYRGRRVDGFKLSLGVLHITSSNLPFDVAVQDFSGTGIDPFKADDFETGRCHLYVLEPQDMEAIRGVPVPV